MKKNLNYTITSSIKFTFNDSKTRNISFNSFQPEYERLKSKRSKVFVEKEGENNLNFSIKSGDITAFRASINEIITFGKIFESLMQLVQNSKNL